MRRDRPPFYEISAGFGLPEPRDTDPPFETTCAAFVADMVKQAPQGWYEMLTQIQRKYDANGRQYPHDILVQFHYRETPPQPELDRWNAMFTRT